MKKLALKAKEASRKLMSIDSKTRNLILERIAKDLSENKHDIVNMNQIDLHHAAKMDLPAAMVDRLKLDSERIDGMVDGVREIIVQKDVVGEIFDEKVNAQGLKIMKQRIPLGVILMIFESRPNVIVDCAALALKSGNAIVLKGGKEADCSNRKLGEIIRKTLESFGLEDAVIVLESGDRESVNELLSLDEYIDVVIPRGGEGLIRHVYENARMPVIAHYKGLCHMYIDKGANKDMILNLVENAKTQRPGVCNAIETLLIHEDLLEEFAPKITKLLNSKNTELRVDEKFQKAAGEKLQIADESDWSTEYLANKLSIKTVASIDAAIEHISLYGSHHSECIISDDKESCQKFLTHVDASCVMVNASTRFNDGSQLGLGAELGISTSKLHAYGPMGIEQMTTSRYVVVGEGHVRG